MTLVLFVCLYYPLLHENLTQGCYKRPLPLRGTPSSMFYDTYDQKKKFEPKHTTYGSL